MFVHAFSRRPAWLAPLSAVLLAVAALVAALGSHRWASVAIAREAARQAQVKAALDDRGAAVAPACAPEVDYAQALPAVVSLDKLVQSLQDGAHAFGATLVSVSGEPRPPTSRAMATLGVTLTLRGAYPAIRSTLSEALSRFPTATLQQMHIKRSSSASIGVEEATLQLVFVLRPAVAAPLACRMSPKADDLMESRWQ